MTIERNYGSIDFLCDGKSCNEFLETETGDFQEAKAVLDQSDWQTRNVRGDWQHVCPACLEAEVKNGLEL